MTPVINLKKNPKCVRRALGTPFFENINTKKHEEEGQLYFCSKLSTPVAPYSLDYSCVAAIMFPHF